MEEYPVEGITAAQGDLLRGITFQPFGDFQESQVPVIDGEVTLHVTPGNHPGTHAASLDFRALVGGAIDETAVVEYVIRINCKVLEVTRIGRGGMPAIRPARLLDELVDLIILDLDATGIPGQSEREILVRTLSFLPHFHAISGAQPAVAETASHLETRVILQGKVHGVRLLRDGPARKGCFLHGGVKFRRDADQRAIHAGCPPEGHLVHIGTVQFRAGIHQ